MNVNVERLREIALAIAERRWGELNMRIPADESRDADLVVAAAAREITTLRAELDTAIRRAEALAVVLREARAAIAPPSVVFAAGYPLPAHLRMTAERAQLLGRIDAAIDAARAEG